LAASVEFACSGELMPSLISRAEKICTTPPTNQ
jgi:hypothetical protein